MKLKQQVELTAEEALKILTKVVENKTKKKVLNAELESGGSYLFSLEDSVVEDAPKAP